MNQEISDTQENRQKIVRVGEALLGTCGSLDTELQAEFGDEADICDFHIDLLHRLDDITMECQQCNWWCETGFLNDQQVCDDCEPAEESE